MSLTHTADGRPVHVPANPKRFEFDAEVSRIFPDMAERSIPNFSEAHYSHAAMIVAMLRDSATYEVMDIGASRGAFFKELKDANFAYPSSKFFTLSAIENSKPMLKYLERDFPHARLYEMDLESDEFQAFTGTYHVVCVNYVLQFVRPEHQERVLQKIIGMVKPGGILVFGHKSKHYGILGDAAHERYISFRMAQGYSLEEIEAKTAALRGSMFPMDHHKLMETLHANFSVVQETYRFMMFSTLMAVK